MAVKTTIDSIVRERLISNHRTIHDYVYFLNSALTCLRNLEFSTPISNKAVELTINSFNELTLPSDYVDIIGLYRKAGIYIVPMKRLGHMNPLAKTNDAGAQVAYGDIFEIESYSDIALSFAPETRINDYGQWLGRQYGGSKNPIWVYEVFEDRNIIQLDPGIAQNSKFLLWYHYRSTTTALTEVHPALEDVIGKYIDYKHIEQKSRTPGNQFTRGDVGVALNEYEKATRLMRRKISPMTLSDIKRVLREGSRPSPKY